MAQAKTPVELLRRDFVKLQEWLNEPDTRTPTVAVGALGELIASKALRLPIVSGTTKEYDLKDGTRTVEVKTRTKNNRIDLRSKACGEVALVRVSRGTSDAGERAIMLARPEPVEVIALLPDDAPRLFVWRGRRFPVARGDGPERLHGEWWRDGGVEGERPYTVRDYYQVETVTGGRYWLFRLGDGVNPSTGPMRWFIHGAFA